MGQRFSDYESTLDFLCNYYKFSVSQLSLTNIKKIVDLNNSISWNSFSANSNKINTRVLATLVFSARQNSDALTSSMINDNLSKASHALSDINSALKEYTDFQKEWYKSQVRRTVLPVHGILQARIQEWSAIPLSRLSHLFTCKNIHIILPAFDLFTYFPPFYR